MHSMHFVTGFTRHCCQQCLGVLGLWRDIMEKTFSGKKINHFQVMSFFAFFVFRSSRDGVPGPGTAATGGQRWITGLAGGDGCLNSSMPSMLVQNFFSLHCTEVTNCSLHCISFYRFVFGVAARQLAWMRLHLLPALSCRTVMYGYRVRSWKRWHVWMFVFSVGASRMN